MADKNKNDLGSSNQQVIDRPDPFLVRVLLPLWHQGG